MCVEELGQLFSSELDLVLVVFGGRFDVIGRIVQIVHELLKRQHDRLRWSLVAVSAGAVLERIVKRIAVRPIERTIRIVAARSIVVVARVAKALHWWAHVVVAMIARSVVAVRLLIAAETVATALIARRTVPIAHPIHAVARFPVGSFVERVVVALSLEFVS